MAKQLYDIRNYPKYSGVSQAMRYDKVLHGETVKLDERKIADFILFAHKFSAYLKYYNASNQEDGNWQGFLQNDISYQLAKTSSLASSEWASVWSELMEPIETNTETEYKKFFTWRYDFLYSLLDEILQTYAGSFTVSGWNTELGALLASAQLNVIYFLLEKYKASSQALLDNNAAIFSFAETTLQRSADAINRINALNENSRSVLLPDPMLFADADFIFADAATVQEQVQAASEYLDELASQLINIWSGINSLAAKYLDQTLTSYDSHQPHVGLFYAFLLLAQEHQAGINDLLINHLDFYYRQVLRVKEKPWIAPTAFVYFELAKNIKEHFVPLGSKLAAGKDSGKKDVFFYTSKDILVNKATIADLRSFVHIKSNGNTANLRQPTGLFASPVANSSDGNGKALQPGESWPIFRSGAQANNLSYGIGLSFYSPLLAEAQGPGKSFTLQVQFANSTPITNTEIQFIQQNMSLKLITDKDPVVIDLTNATKEGNGFKISFTLDDETKILNSKAPNASITVGHKSGVGNINNVFSLFQTASIVNVFISFSSTALEVTNVETTAGPLEISGAFAAFGAVPKPGSSFYVEAPILKNRTVQKLDMLISWGTPTERGITVDTFIDKPTPVELKKNVSIPSSQEDSTLSIITAPKDFTNADRIKLTLRTDLGFSDFGRKYTEAVLDRMGVEFESDDSDLAMVQAIEKALYENTPFNYKERPAIKKPFPENPYTPMIKDISLNLAVSEKTQGSDQSIKLYQQYAFGYAAVALNQAKLIPPTPNEGELYIGIENLEPEQSLNILFQLEEGSADPTLDNPEVSWEYLRENAWHSFQESVLYDGTKGLMQSGVVSFIWPAETKPETSSLMPSGYKWVRASAPFNQANAVCNVIGIHTQAVAAVFQNSNNDTAWLGTNISAGTITGLSPKQPEIKKLTQPYASFGGAATEDASAIYTRTSERLRHKGRGVTRFDYDRIILEQFPNIYKVKTLNHACLQENNAIVSKQGNVLVLVIAKTAAQATLYKPLVSKSVLAAIYDFIKPLGSPFAQIKVMNPVFETLEIVANVVFMPFVTDRIFYEDLLETAIKQFLSPWAFDNNKEPEFGGVVYKAVILDFIEELPYVDFIQNLELLHNGSPSTDMAVASSPAAMLISADAHQVTGVLSNAILSSANTETVGCC